jgi:hypothetical protein
MSLNEYKFKIKFWIQTCKLFRLSWGDAMVPHNVKWCWNDAEDFINVKRSVLENNDLLAVVRCHGPKQLVTVDHLHVCLP